MTDVKTHLCAISGAEASLGFARQSHGGFPTAQVVEAARLAQCQHRSLATCSRQLSRASPADQPGENHRMNSCDLFICPKNGTFVIQRNDYDRDFQLTWLIILINQTQCPSQHTDQLSRIPDFRLGVSCFDQIFDVPDV